MEAILSTQKNTKPFGHWSIWRRHEKAEEGIGPPFFSLFFLGGEGMASYQGLYLRNKIAPRVLAIIQPYGGARDLFLNADSPFYRTVDEAQVKPEWLLAGGYGGPFRCLLSGYHHIKDITLKTAQTIRYTYDLRGHSTLSIGKALREAEKSGFKTKGKNYRKTITRGIAIYQNVESNQ